MENKFELEEMKQQWSTLQTTLRGQKEVNIKLIIKDAKRRVSWNRGLLRTVSFITLLFTVPAFLYVLPHYGVPQPIYITFAISLALLSFNALYMSFLITAPNDGKIDILKYSKSLVKFKKRYVISEIIGTLVVIAMIIWAVITMGFDITHPVVLGMTIGGAIGAIIGVSLAIKFLGNIKELQSDIDLIESLQG